ncbi:Transcriptional regulator [Seminavis robusta]|uniref:Transcriptional regulator n=1 Tax=Seminavis robusta TaxID=568900 RepID=A0A9N8EYP5_9STRA|nr:Transcriptional regulator [Seminavis robusta]|eukprot:Sro2213_g319310.1 Transcriptional regulator (1077) ;mRNA; r:8340-11570
MPLSSLRDNKNEDYRSGEFGLVGAEQGDETAYDTRRPPAVDDSAAPRIEFPQDKIYGRDEEFATLRGLYDDASDGDGPEVVFLSGYSGSGKTRLVNEAFGKTPVFIQGKYEELQTDDVYMGIVEAFGRWYESLKSESRKEFLVHLEEAVGDDIAVVEELIPGMMDCGSSVGSRSSSAMLLGQIDVSTLNKNRVHFVLTCFLKAIGSSVSSEGAFVLFLDDLQWAQTESLELLRAILTDSTINNFLFVGGYRSQEVLQNHPLAEMMDEMDMHLADYETLELKDLNRQHLNAFIADTLNLTPDQVQPLTDAIFSKTFGNIFFTMQALEQLVRKNALYYDMTVFQWQWVDNLTSQHLDELLSNDVVAMIKSKMEEDLSPQLHKVLIVAANLSRNTFDFKTLAAAADTTVYGPRIQSHALQKLLDDAVAEGLLFCSSTNNPQEEDPTTYKYTFYHDRIREAAGSLVVGESREQLLFHIGKVLAERAVNKDQGAEEWMLFGAAHHLNAAPTRCHPTTNDWKLTMAKLNLETARASMAMAAFQKAANYTEHGMAFLPSSNESSWNSAESHDLCFDLYSTAAEACRLTGDIAKMQQYSNNLLQNAQAKDDDKLFKVRYNLAVGLFYGAEQHQESLAIMLDLLSNLNCRFPKGTVSCVSKTIGHLVSLPFAKGKRTNKELEKVEFMERQETFKCMMILDKLFELCYLMKKEDLLPLVIFRAHEYTLKYGLCIYSPKLFAAISLFFSEALNDLKGAAVYANYALALMRKVNHRPIECGTLMIAYFFGLHWTVPVKDCIEPMRHAYTIGTKTGELENPMWCIFNVFLFSFQAGVSLSKIEASIVQHLPEMEAKSLKMIVYCATSFLNLTLTLMGRSTNVENGTETDEAMSEVPVAILIAAAGTRIKQGYFGDYESCAESGLKAGSDVRKASPGGPIPVMDMCVCALSCYIMAQRTGKSKYTREAKSIHKTFKGWAKQGNPNIMHWTLLLDAESAALSGKKKKKVVIEKYESAISLAKEGGYLHDAAIGSERLGEFMLEVLSEEQEAAVVLKQSLRLWQDWGARGKADRMIEKYPQILQQPEEAKKN